MKRFRKGKQQHIRDSLLSFLKSIGLRDHFEENLAIAFWNSTVGKQISDHTDPQKVTGGILFVKVDNDVWRNELSYMKHEIIQKLNRKIGKKVIQEIKFY